jgi:hypothetical protein
MSGPVTNTAFPAPAKTISLTCPTNLKLTHTVRRQIRRKNRHFSPPRRKRFSAGVGVRPAQPAGGRQVRAELTGAFSNPPVNSTGACGQAQPAVAMGMAVSGKPLDTVGPTFYMVAVRAGSEADLKVARRDEGGPKNYRPSPICYHPRRCGELKRSGPGLSGPGSS